MNKNQINIKSHYPLVICYIAIENGDLVRGITHEKKAIFNSVLYVYQRVNPINVP